MNIKQTLLTFASALGALLIVTTITFATSTLTPSEPVGGETHYTLTDIYKKISDFSYTPASPSGLIQVPGTVSATFRSLTEVYNLLANQEDLLPENILEGKEILGVEGTLVEIVELEWSTDQGPMNWATAESTCATLTEGGATAGDWRLPTIQEYHSITDYALVEPSTEVGGFILSTYYWSITEYFDEISNLAWVWDTYGNIYNDSKANNFAHVRCVR